MLLPPLLHQSVLIFELFAAANAKELILHNLVHPIYGPPQLRRSSVAIDSTTVLLRSLGEP